MTVDKGKGERIVVRDAVYHGGMCPRCEGMGSVSDIDLSQLFDDSKSINEGAIKVPGYTSDGWYVRIFGVFLDLDKPIRKYTKQERHDVQAETLAVVCIADLPPSPSSKTRYLVKRLHAAMPDVRIVVGRWGPPALADNSTQALREAGATLVATTLAETRTYLGGLVEIPRIPQRESGGEAAA